MREPNKQRRLELEVARPVPLQLRDLENVEVGEARLGELAGDLEGDHAGSQVAAEIIDIAEGQQENHLCPAACDNGIDDDSDGDVDMDEECEASAWP